MTISIDPVFMFDQSNIQIIQQASTKVNFLRSVINRMTLGHFLTQFSEGDVIIKQDYIWIPRLVLGLTNINNLIV